MERASKFMVRGKGVPLSRRLPIPPVGLSLVLSLGFAVAAETRAETNGITPERLSAPTRTENPEQEEAAVFRFYPAAATEAEASLRSVFAERRNRFLSAMETASRRRFLDASTVSHPSFNRFVSWFREQHPPFPVSSQLARIWALGEPDEAIQDEWTTRLRKAMGSYICGDALAETLTAEPWPVRMVSVTRLNASVDLPTVESWAARASKTNIHTLDQARKNFLEGFSNEQKETARFLVGFLKENCFFDEPLTVQLRQKKTTSLALAEQAGAAGPVARTAETGDVKAEPPLDVPSGSIETEPERASVARQRLEEAHDAGERILDRLANVWRRLREIRQTPASLAGIAILLLILLWWRWRRKSATTLSSRPVARAETRYTVILNPQRKETIFLPTPSAPSPNAGSEPQEALQPVPKAELVPIHDHAWEERVLAAEKRAEELMTMVREGLAPHLARELMKTLVRELISQRAGLLYTHQLAERELTSMEVRFENVISQLEERLAAYEKRNAELEKELAAKKEENLELIKASIVVTQSRLNSDQKQNRAALN